jgi:hypothetical protein
MGTSSTAVHPAVISITYKEREEPLAYHAHEHVRALIDDALVRFRIDKSESRLALFTASGDQLDQHQSLHDAGIGPGDHLTLQLKTIEIIYNGRAVEFDYHAGELVGVLLQAALTTFGITTNAHLMSLFDTENHELKETITVREAGVKPGDTLVLRQSRVKGG